MTINARELVESDLKYTLEGEWGLPVELVDPDGNTYTTSANDPTLDLVGQVMYDTTRMDPDTGNIIVINNPVVSLRRTSLARIPQAGESWIVRIPIRPEYNAPKESYYLGDLPPEGGASIGFIRLYLTKAQQTPP